MNTAKPITLEIPTGAALSDDAVSALAALLLDSVEADGSEDSKPQPQCVAAVHKRERPTPTGQPSHDSQLRRTSSVYGQS
jgi:hypothetical protein